MFSSNKRMLINCPYCNASWRHLVFEQSYILCRRCFASGPNVDPYFRAKKMNISEKILIQMSRAGWNMREGILVENRRELMRDVTNFKSIIEQGDQK